MSQLYPSHLDLHAYRVLLVAATGYTPEEVTALTDTDVEFLPTGVRLTLTKQRAQRVRHRTFGTEPSPDNDAEAVDFTDRPHREVGAIIRRLMHVTAQARLRAPDSWRSIVCRGVGYAAHTSCASRRGRPTKSGPASLIGWPQPG